jgi:hypothetical protein
MKTPRSSRDPGAFWTLRETPLHEMTPALWQDYYPAMAPWLHDTDAQIRECAVERLMMAVLRAEFSPFSVKVARADEAKDRLAWLLGEIEKAHTSHPDIIPGFLLGLRHHGDDEPYNTELLVWLDTLASEQREGIDVGLLKGTRLLVARDTKTVQAEMARHIGLLDDPSDYVRGCAAYLLGNACDEETEPDQDTLFALIGSKERERPGIAGPFFTPQYHDTDDDTRQGVTHWMLNLLEQRTGTAPPLPVMPFNDIEFYLHEICCFSPEYMWRMLRGGHTALALMTATEIADRVDGVEPVLRELAQHTDPRIAAAASRHLAAHYS